MSNENNENLPSIKRCKREDLDPVQDLGRLISYLRARLVTEIDLNLTPMELTSAQYIVVVLLARGTANTLAGLCEFMVYDRGAMSRLLCRLEEKGLVAKAQSAHDKRSTTLHLTEKGKAFYPEVIPVVNEVHQKALKGFSHDEKEQLISLLFKAIENLNDES